MGITGIGSYQAAYPGVYAPQKTDTPAPAVHVVSASGRDSVEIS